MGQQIKISPRTGTKERALKGLKLIEKVPDSAVSRRFTRNYSRESEGVANDGRIHTYIYGRCNEHIVFTQQPNAKQKRGKWDSNGKFVENRYKSITFE